MLNSTSKAWRIISRPVLETVLNNHVQHHRVHQPLILHGPRGVGKTTLIVERSTLCHTLSFFLSVFHLHHIPFSFSGLMENWNKGPHLTGYVDFAQPIKEHHPSHNGSFPWSSWYSCSSPPPTLSILKSNLEKCLESMAIRGIELGQITSHQIFTTLNKWHGLSHTLRHILQSSNSGSKIGVLSNKASASVLWDRAVFAFSARFNSKDLEGLVGLERNKKGMTAEEMSYMKEAVIALRLAREVIRVQQQWRANAVADMNKTGGFSRSLTSSSTDWPYLLLELLSSASEIDHFQLAVIVSFQDLILLLLGIIVILSLQPKLVINNIEILRNAISADDSTACAPNYHDSLIWRIISLGANEMCLPIIFVTSDSYYSYRAYIDFGFPDIFISREVKDGLNTFGWTPNEGRLHMVPDYFSALEWTVVTEVLGTNSRHLFELHALKESDRCLR
ncbi:Disintegrin and metalloproteinase domain-containing protein 12 [Bienertia sinuspersici]